VATLRSDHDVVVLHEMRPARGNMPSIAPKKLGEPVCSNTFKSTETSNARARPAHIYEMRLLGSLILDRSDGAGRVPVVPRAFTVDREVFFGVAVHDRVHRTPVHHGQSDGNH
jgi:methylenetetrahydrofolate--tRNA-(uracil-5-)-methyltransferase